MAISSHQVVYAPVFRGKLPTSVFRYEAEALQQPAPPMVAALKRSQSMKVDGFQMRQAQDAHQKMAATPEDQEDILLEDISVVAQALQEKLDGVHQLDGMDGDQENCLREASAIGMFLENKIKKLCQIKDIYVN